MTTYTQHELSACWPGMPDKEFQALVADIEANGQRVPCVAIGTEILDGWHRYRACVQIGFTPWVTEYEGDPEDRGALVAFVKSLNDTRRHCTESQRAIAAAATAKYLTDGRPKTLPMGSVCVNPNDEGKRSVKQIADDADVSERMMWRAKKVVQQGSPELVQAVRDGEVSVRAAVAVTDLPKEQQLEAAKSKPEKKEKAEKTDEEPPEGGAASEAELAEAYNEVRGEAVLDLQREVEELRRVVQAGDKGAALFEALRRAQIAERRRDELMNEAAALQRSLDWHQRQLSRIGKAVGQRELDRIAPTVEALMRERRKAS